MYMYINEDYIAKWVEKQGGLLITRSIKNIDTFDIFATIQSFLCMYHRVSTIIKYFL